MNKFYYLLGGTMFLFPHVERLRRASLYTGQPIKVNKVDRDSNLRNLDALLYNLNKENTDYQYVHNAVMRYEVYDEIEEFNSIFKLRTLFKPRMTDKRVNRSNIFEKRSHRELVYMHSVCNDLVLAHLLSRGHFLTYVKHAPEGYENFLCLLWMMLYARGQFALGTFAVMPVMIKVIDYCVFACTRWLHINHSC